VMEGTSFFRGSWAGALNGSCVWSDTHYSESDFNLTEGVGHTTVLTQYSWADPYEEATVVNFSVANHHGGAQLSARLIREHMEKVRRRGRK
jgi:hypothetical protein